MKVLFLLTVSKINCLVKATGDISEITNRFIVEPLTLTCGDHKTSLSGTAIGSDERAGLRFYHVTGKILQNDMRFIFLVDKPINLGEFEIEYNGDHPIRFENSAN